MAIIKGLNDEATIIMRRKKQEDMNNGTDAQTVERRNGGLDIKIQRRARFVDEAW